MGRSDRSDKVVPKIEYGGIEAHPGTSWMNPPIASTATSTVPRKRILFLVDRNILADQTKTNDFKPFGQAMTKITNRKVDKAFEIYLALYQAVTGTDDEQNIYKQFSPDFFDLVIIDDLLAERGLL